MSGAEVADAVLPGDRGPEMTQGLGALRLLRPVHPVVGDIQSDLGILMRSVTPIPPPRPSFAHSHAGVVGQPLPHAHERVAEGCDEAPARILARAVMRRHPGWGRAFRALWHSRHRGGAIASTRRSRSMIHARSCTGSPSCSRSRRWPTMGLTRRQTFPGKVLARSDAVLDAPLRDPRTLVRRPRTPRPTHAAPTERGDDPDWPRPR